MSIIPRRHVASLLRPLLQSRSAAARLSFTTRTPSTLLYRYKPSNQLRAIHQSPRLQDDAATGSSGDVTTFEELGTRDLVAETVLRSVIQDMKLKTMTPVQVQTINPCLQGKDVIAQAKTGTGKTLGFLIPVIQRILKDAPDLAVYNRQRRMRPDIRAIIISPTRELAEQIAVEAKKVCRHTALKVQTAVGGTQKSMHLRQIQNEGCHILVGTPGRLADILSDPSSGVDAPKLDAFVLDEADRLLDQGFAPEIQKIHNELLPRKEEKDRQTLMFSATMPREVIQTVKQLMKRDFQFVQTVKEDDVPTHEKVPQKRVETVGMQNLLPTLVELVQREMEAGKTNGRPFKAIVFHNANAEVVLYSSIFDALTGRTRNRSIRSDVLLPGLRVTQMHSRLSQNARTRNSDFFRKTESAILFSSDVSARGMDFPNVTHVIQLGFPQNTESYIHRIGRTGRGDKTGVAYMFTTPVDNREAIRRLRAMPVEKDTSLQCASVDMTQDGQVPASASTILTASMEAAKNTDPQTRDQAYGSVLGAMAWADSRTLVENMNNMSKFCWGMEIPPPIAPGLASKLGISRMPGLNLNREPREPREQKSFGGSSDRGGFGGGRSQGGFQRRSGSGGFDGGRSPGGYSRGRSEGGFERRGSSGGYDRGRSQGGFERRSGNGGYSSGRSEGGFERRSSYGGGQRSSESY